jgi:translation initiation factor 6
VVQRIDERLSALGNCIACNDYVALIHPDIDKETEEIVQVRVCVWGGGAGGKRGCFSYSCCLGNQAQGCFVCRCQHALRHWFCWSLIARTRH